MATPTSDDHRLFRCWLEWRDLRADHQNKPLYEALG